MTALAAVRALPHSLSLSCALWHAFVVPFVQCSKLLSVVVQSLRRQQQRRHCVSVYFYFFGVLSLSRAPCEFFGQQRSSCTFLLLLLLLPFPPIRRRYSCCLLLFAFVYGPRQRVDLLSLSGMSVNHDCDRKYLRSIEGLAKITCLVS